ncbi:hypothetical protein QBC40DRAFT_85777 [Triangularia verruculosa]|uniref:C2H2-type domain-containing protein n=1 Tax=Triangularia verruculosa TaxID=2587418 RepID=A0AAN7ATX4_9PEZI|nr:hypothetical protein QBC40DRAFT_85777 [Triangularia verruculosa]
MGTHHYTQSDDPFPWPGLDDSSIFGLGTGEVFLDGNQLPFLGETHDHQQSAQGSDETQDPWSGNEAFVNGSEFFYTATDSNPFSESDFQLFSCLEFGPTSDLGFGPLPELDFDMATTDNSTPTNTASTWTPLGLSASPGTNPSVAASDISCSSPSQLAAPVPYPLPIAPRPIAPAPHHTIKFPHDQVDQQTLQGRRESAVTTVSHDQEQPPVLGVARPRGSRSMPARERRKIAKPEKCQVCGKGHTYQALLNRHIEAHHKNEAHLFGVSIERTPCPKPGCSQSFANTRPDHLSRHIKRKHKGP